MQIPQWQSSSRIGTKQFAMPSKLAVLNDISNNKIVHSIQRRRPSDLVRGSRSSWLTARLRSSEHADRRLRPIDRVSERRSWKILRNRNRAREIIDGLPSSIFHAHRSSPFVSWYLPASLAAALRVFAHASSRASGESLTLGEPA